MTVEPTEGSVDMDRPVTLREFRFEIGELIKRFDKLEAERAEEKKEREADRAKAEAERTKAEEQRAKAEKELAKAEEERIDMWKKFDEGKILIWLQMYFKIHKGEVSSIVHHTKEE